MQANILRGYRTRSLARLRRLRTSGLKIERLLKATHGLLEALLVSND